MGLRYGHCVESPPGSPSGFLTGTTSKMMLKTPVRVIFVFRRPRTGKTRIRIMMGGCTKYTYITILRMRKTALASSLTPHQYCVLISTLPSVTVIFVSGDSQASFKDTFNESALLGWKEVQNRICICDTLLLLHQPSLDI